MTAPTKRRLVADLRAIERAIERIARRLAIEPEHLARFSLADVRQALAALDPARPDQVPEALAQL